jgi:hypothetical protein
MSLLERYLHEVRRHLPRRERDDIVAELRETLRSQVEAEEAQQGRGLTDDEAAAMLMRYGKPSTVAERYGAPRYLIGPEVYPSYVFSVKLILWITAPFAALSVGAALSLGDGPSVITRVIKPIWQVGLILASNLALVTLIFAWGERRGSRRSAPERWDPRDLPPLPRHGDPIPRRDAVGSLVATTFVLLWWLGVNGAVWRWFGGEPTSFEWRPVFSAVTPAVVAVVVASIVREVVGLLRPYRVRLYLAAGILLDLLAIPVLLTLLRAGEWVTVTDPGVPAAPHVASINFGIFTALLVVTLVVAADAVWEARRLVLARRTMPAV